MLTIDSYVTVSIKSFNNEAQGTYLKAKKIAMNFFYELKSSIQEFISSSYKYWHTLDGLVFKIASDALSKRYLYWSGLLKDFSRSLYQRYLNYKIEHLKGESLRQQTDLRMLYEKLGVALEQSDKDRATKTWAIKTLTQNLEKQVLAFQHCKEHEKKIDELRSLNLVLALENAKLKEKQERDSFAVELKIAEESHFPDLQGIKELLSSHSLDPFSVDSLVETKLPNTRKQLVFFVKQLETILDKLPIDMPSRSLIVQARFLINTQLVFFDKVLDALSSVKFDANHQEKKETINIPEALYLLQKTLQMSERDNV